MYFTDLLLNYVMFTKKIRCNGNAKAAPLMWYCKNRFTARLGGFVPKMKVKLFPDHKNEANKRRSQSGKFLLLHPKTRHLNRCQ